MKKTGTLNRHLSELIASMGHSDLLVICDSGLSIPYGARTIDLALKGNVPRFLETVEVVLEELEVESATVASEMKQVSPSTYNRLEALMNGVPISTVPHEELKKLHAEYGNIAYLRTGETTPYANVVLEAGVTFG